MIWFIILVLWCDIKICALLQLISVTFSNYVNRFEFLCSLRRSCLSFEYRFLSVLNWSCGILWSYNFHAFEIKSMLCSQGFFNNDQLFCFEMLRFLSDVVVFHSHYIGFRKLYIMWFLSFETRVLDVQKIMSILIILIYFNVMWFKNSFWFFLDTPGSW